MKTNMHFGASPAIFNLARYLRKHPTEAEEFFWKHLKNHQMGSYKFRRQHPMWNYVVDFYCHPLRLVIELDGGIHTLPENKISDQEKEEGIKNLGLHLIRFSNREVFENVDDVLSKLRRKMDEVRFLPHFTPVLPPTP